MCYLKLSSLSLVLWFSKAPKNRVSDNYKTKKMKYKKVILGTTTVDNIKDHLNEMVVGGIVKIEKAVGDIKPTSKNIQFFLSSYKRNRLVEFDKNFPDHGAESFLFIHCEGFGLYGREVFDFGDTFYLGKGIVFVIPKRPGLLDGKIKTMRITLLSKSDEPDAIKVYREMIRCMINRTFVCNKWNRPPATEDDIDQHIAFLDQHKGKEVKNPAYPYVDPDPQDDWEPSC